MPLDVTTPSDNVIVRTFAAIIREIKVAINTIESNVTNSLIPALTNFSANNSTPSVAGGVGFKTNNTGGITISNFLGGYEGQLIVITAGDSNTTIGYDPGLIQLTGKGDMLLIPGQSVPFILSGGIWREIGGNRIYTVKEVTDPIYQSVNTDTFVKCNATTNAIQVALCAASEATVGVEYIYKKSDDSVNLVTVAGYELTMINEVARFISDGTSWDKV